jgi:phosphomevalonate kinase
VAAREHVARSREIGEIGSGQDVASTEFGAANRFAALAIALGGTLAWIRG